MNVTSTMTNSVGKIGKYIGNVILAMAAVSFILSAAIAIPLTFRGIYYAQIEALGIPDQTGYSDTVIRDAFDEMMDYCTGGGEAAGVRFGTGSLAWSEEGKAHFDDCAVLFRLDFTVFWISLAVLVLGLLTYFLGRKRNLKKQMPKQNIPGFWKNRGPFFWGPVIFLVVALILGILAAFDFDAFFTGFHHLFFPGKENWIFDPAKDEIIRILPETLFRNYAIIILGGILLFSAVFIGMDLLAGRHRKKKHCSGDAEHNFTTSERHTRQ